MRGRAATLRKRVPVEQEPDLRRRWLKSWHELEGEGPLLAFAVSQPSDRIEEVFAVLHGKAGEIAWESLAPLVALDEPEAEKRVLTWLKLPGAPAAAREWLLSLALRETEPRMPWEPRAMQAWQVVRTARHLLLEALEGMSARELGAGEWPLLSGLRELLEARPADEREEEEEFFDEAQDMWVYGPSVETQLLQRLQQLLSERVG